MFENVANMANTHSQSTQTIATKSLQAEWNFLQRVVQIEEELFFPIRNANITFLSSRPCLVQG